MLPTTTRRVQDNTSSEINERIRRAIVQSIAEHAAGGRAAVDRRLAELDREWDMERVLEANASVIALAGTVLGLLFGPLWLLIPLAVTAFLLLHALEGWCPPVPFFRKRGFRTASEIDSERYALKLVRGDFNDVVRRGLPADPVPPEQLLDAINA